MAVVFSIWSPMDLAGRVVNNLPLLNLPVGNTSSSERSLEWLSPDSVPPLITRSLSRLRPRSMGPNIQQIIADTLKDMEMCRGGNEIKEVRIICRPEQSTEACSKVPQPPKDVGLRFGQTLVIQHCMKNPQVSIDLGAVGRGCKFWEGAWLVNRPCFGQFKAISAYDMAPVKACLDRHILHRGNVTDIDPCDIFDGKNPSPNVYKKKKKPPPKDQALKCSSTSPCSYLEQFCGMIPEVISSKPLKTKRNLLPVHWSDVSPVSRRVARCTEQNLSEYPDADPESVSVHCRVQSAKENACAAIVVGALSFMSLICLVGLYIKCRASRKRREAARLIRHPRINGGGDIWYTHQMRLKELQGNTFTNRRIPELVEENLSEEKEVPRRPGRWFRDLFRFGRKSKQSVHGDDEQGMTEGWVRSSPPDGPVLASGTGNITETFTIPPAPGSRVMNGATPEGGLGKKKSKDDTSSGRNGEIQQHQRAVSSGATTAVQPQPMKETSETSGHESNGSRRRQPSGEQQPTV
ncbi:MAG: hypothetical protein M1823_000752 [Watsoniomyces obsoletus]|nr:MAG: hypothetical protein M1823_000752 [Watsoniomyces obsoletus]